MAVAFTKLATRTWRLLSVESAGTAGGFRLEKDRLLAAGGRSYPIRAGADAGRVERVLKTPFGLVLEGWTSTGAGAPAERILIFSGTRLLFSAVPSRPDSDGGRSGFQALLLPELSEGARTVRLFALTDGGAIELEPARLEAHPL